MISDCARSPERSMFPWLVTSLLLFAILFVRSVFNLSWAINHDCAMYLSAGQLLLQGKIPYIDFIDLNPPLVFYINVVPAYLSQITGIDASMVFAICTWSLCLASWLLCAAMLSRDHDNDSRYVGPLLFAFAAFNFWVGEWGDFGQRQHLATIAIVPFIFCRWLRSKGSKVPAGLSATSGIFSGIMLALVPQYLLVPAAVEVVFQQRRFNLAGLFAPEMVCAAISGLACAASLFLLPAVATDEYLHRWLPLIIQGYSAYNHDWLSFTLFPVTTGFFPLFFFGLYLANKHSCSLSVPMLIWCVAAYLAAFFQQKGWSNHYLPCFAGVMLLAALQCEILADDKMLQMGMRRILATMALLAVCTMPAIYVRQLWHHPKSELETIKKETVPGDRVIILSTAVADLYPALMQANRGNGSRYLFLFPIEMVRYIEMTSNDEKVRKGAEREEKRVLSDIQQDIEISKPALILIPLGSMSEYFQKNGLQDYIKARFTKIGECAGRISSFEVWKAKKLSVWHQLPSVGLCSFSNISINRS